MKIKTVKLTTNGRINILSPLRKKYGLTPGRCVKFETADEGIVITPLVTSEEVKMNAGFRGIKGKLLKALMKEKSKIRP